MMSIPVKRSRSSIKTDRVEPFVLDRCRCDPYDRASRPHSPLFPSGCSFSSNASGELSRLRTNSSQSRRLQCVRSKPWAIIPHQLGSSRHTAVFDGTSNASASFGKYRIAPLSSASKSADAARQDNQSVADTNSVHRPWIDATRAASCVGGSDRD